MKLYSLTIKNTEFKVAVADNYQTRAKGLSGLPKLGSKKGMLFAWPEDLKPEMIMRDMNFGLDFLFLDKDFEVVFLGSLEADSKLGITSPVPVRYVLEITAGTITRLHISLDMRLKPDKELLEAIQSGIHRFKDGGVFEVVGEKSYKVKETDIKVDPNKLQILDNNGVVVANIEPGSRIFSRVHTKELINKYKNGDKIGLAKLMLDIIEIQDNQKPDYVRK